MQCLLGINAAAKAKPENWRASAWLLERLFPLRYGRPRFILAARTMAAQAVEALLGAAVEIVERSARPERREAEVENLLAVADEIVGTIRAGRWGN
jgi:hypothetical protein